MRPDTEDFDDIEDQVPQSRTMSWLVLAVAVAGFAGLAFYAYKSGNNTPDGEATVIEADADPIKEVPTDPEGEEFANQDKTIYDVIAADGEKKAEKLLPEPEQPVVAATSAEDSEPAPAAAPAETKPAEVAPVAETKPAPTPAPTTYVAESAEEKAEAAAPTAKPEPAKPAAEKSYAAPEMINEKPTKPKAPEPKQTAAPISTGGSYRVQLGAYKTEDEAQNAWKKINGKYGSVIGGNPVIVKVDIPNKGIFYRLRAGGFASMADAKATCAKLAPQPCMAVK